MNKSYRNRSFLIPRHEHVKVYSKILEYIPGEAAEDRHKRRLDEAIKAEPTIKEWCSYRGIEFFQYSNDHMNGYVMKFQVRLHKSAAIAGWIPAFGRAWKSPDRRNVEVTYSKINDWQQLFIFLESWKDSIPQ